MKRCRYAFKALGSVFSVSIFTTDERRAHAAVSSAKSVIDDFEAEFSRFRPDSHLSILNRIGRLPVSERFARIVAASTEAFERTDGHFNPFVDVSGLGYSRSFEDGTDPVVPIETAPVKFSEFRWEGDEAVLPVGAKIDFGAIGKGFLADEIAELLGRSGFRDFVLDFGGDVVARGVGGDGRPHEIAIASPFVPDETIGTVALSDASVSTSGSSVRRWKAADGRELHHLRSPYGHPTDDIASVTVLAPNGRLSDALATGLFAAGLERGVGIARKNGIDAIFVTRDGGLVSTVRDETAHGLSMR